MNPLLPGVFAVACLAIADVTMWLRAVRMPPSAERGVHLAVAAFLVIGLAISAILLFLTWREA